MIAIDFHRDYSGPVFQLNLHSEPNDEFGRVDTGYGRRAFGMPI